MTSSSTSRSSSGCGSATTATGPSKYIAPPQNGEPCTRIFAIEKTRPWSPLSRYLRPNTLHSRLSHLPWLLVASVLTACGGSGGGGGETEVTALEEMNVAVGALQSTYSTSDFTSIEDLPTSGVSTYNGYLSARYGNEPGVPTSMLVGHMTIDVDFDEIDGMVSGEAHSFLDQDSNRLTGTLMLSGGVFDNTNPGGEDATFRFEADGDLTDAQSRQLGVEMTFNGDFYGSEGDALAGDVFGGVTVDGAMDPESLAGWFISEKETP